MKTRGKRRGGVKGFIGLLMMLSWSAVLAQAPMSSEELEDWFNSEEDEESRALAVNEGALRFLATLPPGGVHTIEHQLRITPQSLENGFVALYQCHQNLDAVAEAQVVYRYKRLRHLRVVSHKNISRVWVEGNSIQMQDVGKEAGLCVSAEVGILYAKGKDSYVLHNGPFHRRFLDGFYPMRVILTVNYPKGLLRYVSTQPPPQAGLSVQETPEGLILDARFEGRLMLAVNFDRLAEKDGGEGTKR
jgi:hypothetical protein